MNDGETPQGQFGYEECNMLAALQFTMDTK